MSAFHSTQNKKVLRQQWDSPILERRAANLNRRLNYLGMCGGDIEDLLDWRQFLDYRTAVQRVTDVQDRLVKQRILTNIGKYTGPHDHLLSEHFELRIGQIEDLVIRGRDSRNVTPHLGVGLTDVALRYDLYNFDFEGGWCINSDLSSRHSEMLK